MDEQTNDGTGAAPAREQGVTVTRGGYTKKTRATELAIAVTLRSEQDCVTGGPVKALFVFPRVTIQDVQAIQRAISNRRGRMTPETEFVAVLEALSTLCTGVEGFADFEEVTGYRGGQGFKNAFLNYFGDETDWVMGAWENLQRTLLPVELFRTTV